MDPITPDSATNDTVDPIGPDPDGVLFTRLKGWSTASIDHLADWRKGAETCYDFKAGNQWGKKELEIFEADGRPAPVFNLVDINVKAITGLEVNNRQQLKFIPRSAGDVQVNELLSSAADWVRDQAKSDREESRAFSDAATAGVGCTETRKGAPDQITVDRRSPLEMFWDKNATKGNLSDRRFAGRVVWKDLDEAETMFPGVHYAELNAKWAIMGEVKQGTESKDYPEHQRTGPGLPEDNRPKRVCMVEIEWYDWEGIQKVYKQAFLGQTSVLEVNPLEVWAYNFMTGEYDEIKKMWYGIVRALIDPQRILNKFLATIIHILAVNAKGGLMYERGAFADQRLAERDWSNPAKSIELAEGALVQGKIKNREVPQLPQGAVMLIEFTMQNISRVSGVNVELLGSADRDQPASLEMQRRQSAVSTQASLFDSKRFYHEEQGRTLWSLMKTLPPEMLARITIDPFDAEQAKLMFPPQPQMQPGMPPEAMQQAMQQWQQKTQAAQQALQEAEEGKKREVYVQMGVITKALSDDAMKFDIIVDEAPTSPNQQQEILGKLQVLSQNGVALPPEAQAIVVKNIGLPSTMADELAKSMSGQNPEVMELHQQLQAGAQQLQQVQAENAQLKADRSIDQQKIQIDRDKVAIERTKANTDAITQTGGVPLGDQIVPAADVLTGLAAQVDQLNQAVSAILRAARGGQ